LVAFAARSASRCTSSATTAKPRLLARHGGLNRGIEGKNVRLLRNVIDEFDDIADSCELSPRRLMRLLVSWMASRIAFMPSMVRRTASRPCAQCRLNGGHIGANAPVAGTSPMDAAISSIDSLAAEICRDWAPLAFAMFAAAPCVCLAAPSSWMALSLMVVTSSRTPRSHS